MAVRRLLRARVVFDLRGLLADEYVDAGHWRVGGLKYRLTKSMESTFLRRADAVVMLTERIRDELLASNALPGEKVEVIPCCVDVSRFVAAAAGREQERAARGWTERLVVAYVGKLGTWYLPAEMARFFAALRQREPRALFAVMTQSPPDAMRAALRENGVPDGDTSVALVPPEQLPRALGACDAGVSFIRPSYSKRASSPTKIGEYLAAGLPVVANTGSGDVDELIAGHRIGVLTASFDPAALDHAAVELLSLLREADVRERCRTVARAALGLDAVAGPRYRRVLEGLLDRS